MENTKRLNIIKIRMKNLKVFLQGHVKNIIQKQVSVHSLKSHRDNIYANVKHVYGNIQKKFELIKKEQSTIKKDNNFIKSDISYNQKVISANENNLEKHLSPQLQIKKRDIITLKGSMTILKKNQNLLKMIQKYILKVMNLIHLIYLVLKEILITTKRN